MSAIVNDIFDPVKLSLPENLFLREVAGQPPVVVQERIPARVNPRAVMPVVQRIYELTQLESHSGQRWAGVEVVQRAIDVYLEQANKWQADRRRGRVRFPSMASYDRRGGVHRGATGSDAGQVQTYFDAQGNRKRFEVELIPNETPFWLPPGTGDDATKASGLSNDTEKCRIECLICNHTEKYKAESRSSYNAARARMSKHLRTAKDQVDDHRETYTLEFGA